MTTALGSGVKGGHLISLSAVSSFRFKKIIAPMWKTLMKFVDFGKPTSFLDHVYLGCTQRESKRNEIVIQEHRKCSNHDSPMHQHALTMDW